MVDELAQQPRLVSFERLAIVNVGALRALGLRLEPPAATAATTT